MRLDLDWRDATGEFVSYDSEKRHYKTGIGVMDFTRLTKWTTRLVYLHMAMSVIALITGALEYTLLDELLQDAVSSPPKSVAAGDYIDAEQALVLLFQHAIFAASAILTLRWIYRASCNCRELGATGMQFSPGWSVGWYFIPVFNFWKPYQAMKEIWQASANPRIWSHGAAPGLLLAWWFSWLVSSVLWNASSNATLSADDLPKAIAASVVAQLSALASILSCIALLSVVKRVYAMQKSQFLALPDGP